MYEADAGRVNDLLDRTAHSRREDEDLRMKSSLAPSRQRLLWLVKGRAHFVTAGFGGSTNYNRSTASNSLLTDESAYESDLYV